MGFEDIKLPDFVIADLYKNSLIEGQKNIKTAAIVAENKVAESAIIAKPIAAENAVVPIKYLGENRKNVVIVINDNEAVFIGDEKLQLLTNLLGACKLTIADVAIINTASQTANYKQIKQEMKPKYLLLMGKTSKDISLSFIFPEYKIQEYDHCQMLIATDLQILLVKSDTVTAEKRKLWESLKLLFKL